MFRRLSTKSRASAIDIAARRHACSDRQGRDIQARIAKLRSVPREQLADVVFLLSIAAKQLSEVLRQSVEQNTGAQVDSASTPDGDLAEFLAVHAVTALRCHEVSPPVLGDLLFERSPHARFTVDESDAIAMLAAMVREQRIEGILEGLRLAGLLNEPSKTRHAGIGSVA